MSHTSYSVGSAFAQALSQASMILHGDSLVALRPVDFINVGRFCAEEAHALIRTDAARARDLLITGASRMLAAAEMLDRRDAPPSADVIPFPGGAGRSILRVVS
ncbi:hypothetical protein NUH86_10820 [Sphingobium sp. JS3065]|uniref:hypothetical protein n=1 Tax=Sphingobium sp. JS3065 TaxID=2970925 RepID=UPI002264153F|nr:hypothetical protein [Sphingobium sp. JS3065]UZW54027.1 hypothetical protein NUH86_10820 [Sphingobium sp. JS3065]